MKHFRQFASGILRISLLTPLLMLILAGGAGRAEAQIYEGNG